MEGSNKEENEELYVNKEKKDENVEYAKSHLTPIYFNMAVTDFDQPWFHQQATRSEIENRLRTCQLGTFAVRPSSSYGGCYAISWTGENGVRHNLVYNQFPGYSLKQNPEYPDETFCSLTELISTCDYLKYHLPNCYPELELANKLSLKRTSSDIVASITSMLLKNHCALTTIEWSIAIVEGPETYINPTRCETRTCIRYANEEHVAPAIFKIEKESAKAIFNAISQNYTILSIKLTGHSGITRLNFTPNITDEEVKYLVSSLKNNKSVTLLNLSRNGITNRGAKHLATLVRHNSTFKKLNLDDNFIVEEGLAALAESLRHNKTLEVLSVSNQLRTTWNKSVVLSSHPYDRVVVRLVEDSFKRRNELLIPWEGFHGYLDPEEAENRILEFFRMYGYGTSGLFLIYIHRLKPNSLWLCYVPSTGPELSFFHKPIYRAPFGYSFCRKIESDGISKLDYKYIPVPSLFVHCAWLVCSSPKLLLEADIFSPEIRNKISDVQDLVDLWRISELPSPNNFHPNVPLRFGNFPTLTQLVQQNKTIFRHVVPNTINKHSYIGTNFFPPSLGVKKNACVLHSL